MKKGNRSQLPVFNYDDFLVHEFASSGDDIVETLVPRGGATLLYSLPKCLKSWITLDLAVGAACGRAVLGHFHVPRAVRVLLVQVEDRPGEVQERFKQLMFSQGKISWPEPEMLRVIPRCPLNLTDPTWANQLEDDIGEQESELVIFDVFRRLFRGDVNLPRDTAEFLEVLDQLRDEHGCSTFLVHHSNKGRKGRDMQTHSLGSVNLTAWADVLLEVKNKRLEEGVTKVDLEIESKSVAADEVTTVFFDLGASPILIAKEGGESEGLSQARPKLKGEFTVKDLEKVLACSNPTASRRIQKWMDGELIEQLDTRAHGQHVYRFKSAKLIQ